MLAKQVFLYSFAEEKTPRMMPNRPAGFITEAQVWKTHPNGYRYRILLLQQMLSIYYLRTKDYQFTKHGPSSTMDFSQNLHV
jgi:hypothetical protein